MQAIAPLTRGADFAALLSQARFTECLDFSALDGSPAALLARMRALLALDRHHEVVRADVLDAVARLDTFHRAHAQALLATAFFRCEMSEPGQLALTEAYALAERANNTDALAEARHYHALNLWTLGQYDEATELVSGNISLPDWRAKALEMRAWFAYKRNEPEEHYNILRAAWSEAYGDTFTRARILLAMSSIVREVYHEDISAQVQLDYAGVRWTADTRIQQAGVLHNYGICSALSGNCLRASDYYSESYAVAPNDAYRTLALVDKARLAAAMGESVTLAKYLNEASAVAHGMDWKDAGEARSALLDLGELWATRDSTTARSFIQQYCDIPIQTDKRLGISKHGDRRDPRQVAMEQYAAGVVYRQSGMRQEALAALEDALQINRTYKQYWRAYKAAMQLGQMTGRDKYMHLARDLSNHFPRSPLTRMLEPQRKRLEHPEVQALSGARQAILRAFTEGGGSNKEIAQRLGVSPHTVSKRLSEIYEAFGVHSKAEFWHALTERGIV